MELCKLGQGTKGVAFVRSVQAAPEPMCLLSTDRQLDEMVRNCTSSSNFVAVSVDPTFDLGSFYVTPMVFPLRMMTTTESRKSPTYLGPILIHQTMTYAAYHYLASQVVGLRPQLKNIRAVGTDGEKPLYNAMMSVFPYPVHLRCFLHFRKNNDTKLRSLNFPQETIREILRDIFGLHLESETQVGLVDSANESDFRAKLEKLKPRWDELERQHRLMQKADVSEPEFHQWFVEQESHVVINNMLIDVRQKAGMGSTPDHFFTNLSESMNAT
jgi:hypothetical protein